MGHTHITMMRHACVLLTLVIQAFHVADGAATLRLTFVSYRNLGGYDANNRHCDFILNRACDNVFDICVDRTNGSNAITSCAFLNKRTGEFSNDDNIMFDYDMMGVANPITITLDKWQGVKLKVRVTDDDSGHLFNPVHDLVDLLVTVHTTIPGVNGSYNFPHTDVIHSYLSRQRPTSLTVKFEVRCDVTFYGPDCTHTCVHQNNVSGHYTCDANGDKVCLPGWESPSNNCMLIVQGGCRGNPCLNGGSCAGEDGVYTCRCSSGFIGVQCESTAEPCTTNTCINGGSCLQNGLCNCTEGFHGYRCEVKRHKSGCTTCANGGTCIANRCECSLGYKGSNCEVITSCNVIQCQHGGLCNQGACSCLPGFLGRFCEINYDSTTIIPVHSSTTGPLIRCQNGGCLVRGACLCPSGISGNRCQLNPCDYMQCDNGGTCIAGWCRCPPGFSGAFCHVHNPHVQTGNRNNNSTVTPPTVNTNPTCDSTLCQHGGMCGSGHSCECRAGYLGDHCEVVLCDHITCYNGGSCQGGGCICSNGFAGIYCQDAVNTKCNLFYYGSTCGVFCKPRSDSQGHYKCDAHGNKVCLDGWEGVSSGCTVAADDCVGHQCQNGAQCQDHEQTYTCNCQPGFTGIYCEIEVDECASNPCYNGAACRNLLNRFECACPPDYPRHLSATCRNYICPHSNQCQNGGTCLGAGRCTCTPPYTGSRCEVILCDVLPCRNGGSCVKGRCLCPAGLTGSHCHKVTGNCAGRPCMNQATCVQDGGAYTCACTSGFVGHHCQNRKYNLTDVGLVPAIAGTSGRPERRAPAACSLASSGNLFVWMLMGVSLLLLLVVLILACCLYRGRRRWRKRIKTDGSHSPTAANFNNPLYRVTALGRRHHSRRTRAPGSRSSSRHRGASGGGSRHPSSLPLSAKTISIVNDGLWDQNMAGGLTVMFGGGQQNQTKWASRNALDCCGPPPSYDVGYDVTNRAGVRNVTKEMEESFDDGVDPGDFELDAKSTGGFGEAEYADLDEIEIIKVH